MTGIRQTVPAVLLAGRRFRAYTAKHLDVLTARAGLDAAERLAVRAVATVLPFRTNEYVVERPHRLGRGARRPDLPPGLPAGGHAARRGRAADRRPAGPRRARGGGARGRARGADPAEPASRRAAGPQHPRPRRRAAARGPAQVPGDRAGLPQAGPDLPRVLHLLLPVGAVRGRARPQDGDRRHGPGHRLPAAAPRGDERPDHRRGSDDHGRGRCCGATSSRCSTRGSSTSSRSGSGPSRWATGRSGSSPTRTPTTRCGCSRRSPPRARAWPSWRTSPTPGSSSRPWWPRRCAGSGRPAG